MRDAGRGRVQGSSTIASLPLLVDSAQSSCQLARELANSSTQNSSSGTVALLLPSATRAVTTVSLILYLSVVRKHCIFSASDCSIPRCPVKASSVLTWSCCSGSGFPLFNAEPTGLCASRMQRWKPPNRAYSFSYLVPVVFLSTELLHQLR